MGIHEKVSFPTETVEPAGLMSANESQSVAVELSSESSAIITAGGSPCRMSSQI